jgi:hypothetical protein|tara:strand:+ start:2482 stop:2778 length:297 start_codon:yes stop_codon:yes gene_type:complete
MILIVLFVLFTGIGYGLSYYIHYLPHQNDPDKKYTKKLILTWDSKDYHIHHWITFSLIILLLVLGKFSPNWLIVIFIGLSLGTIFEDFLFDNIFKIEI